MQQRKNPTNLSRGSVNVKEVFKRAGLVVFLMYLGIGAYIMAMYCIDVHVNPVRLWTNAVNDNVYRTVSIQGLSDNITIETVKFCAAMPIDLQAECVVGQIMPYYKYEDHKGVWSPDEFVKHGGVCRDFSTTAASIFKYMGWKTYYNFNVPHHVYIEVTKNYLDEHGIESLMRCTIDGANYNCVKY